MTPTNQLYKVASPGRVDRLVLDLATAIHNVALAVGRVADPAVSIEAQNAARDYVAEHGYKAGRERLAQLRKAARRRRRLERLVYAHTHRDYRGKVQGVPSVLHLEKGGTCLAPVSALSDDELLAKLPRAVREAFEAS